MVLFVIIVIAMFIVLTIIHGINDKASDGSGYRYSDIPSDLNMLELLLIFILSKTHLVPPLAILMVLVAQFVICLHSIYISCRSRRPDWFDWL